MTNILKYIGIDLLGVVSNFVLYALLNPYVGTPVTGYVVLFVVCFLSGFFFAKGYFHGISISLEMIVLSVAILFMIGRPTSMPLSEVLKKEIIVPLLPFLLIGLSSGFAGEKLKTVLGKMKK